MDEIKNDKIELEEEKLQDEMIGELLKEKPELFEKYPILEIEYNKDGSKKEFYYLASEKDIKSTQLKSDENELDYKYSQNKISKDEYEIEKDKLKNKLLNQNLVYDNLIFDLIRNEDMDVLKGQIRSAALDNIELKRLAMSLSSIAENKINDFQTNNSDFKKTNLAYWNYKYDVIAKNYAKTRELETFILSLIE